MSAPIPMAGPRRPETPVLALVLVVVVAGLGSFVAAGTAAERGENVRTAPGVSPENAGADTVTGTLPAPWAIPLLRPARVEVRTPAAPMEGDEPPPPLVRLSVADAPTTPGFPGQTVAEPALPAPVPLSAREVEAILAPLPDLPRSDPSAGDQAAPVAAHVAAQGAAARAAQGEAPPPSAPGLWVSSPRAMP
ncbi:hypothetical protein BH23GEM11_BH23GEM11_13750 [soil metagenome]